MVTDGDEAVFPLERGYRNGEVAPVVTGILYPYILIRYTHPRLIMISLHARRGSVPGKIEHRPVYYNEPVSVVVEDYVTIFAV